MQYSFEIYNVVSVYIGLGDADDDDIDNDDRVDAALKWCTINILSIFFFSVSLSFWSLRAVII